MVYHKISRVNDNELQSKNPGKGFNVTPNKTPKVQQSQTRLALWAQHDFKGFIVAFTDYIYLQKAQTRTQCSHTEHFVGLLSHSHAKVLLKNTQLITTPCVGYAVSVRLLKIIIQYHAESCVQIGQRIRQSFSLPLTICHCQCRLLFTDRWSILQPRRQRCTYERVCAENICATQTTYTLALHIRPVRR